MQKIQPLVKPGLRFGGPLDRDVTVADAGPIGLIRDGDIITLDAVTGEISVNVSDEEFAQRKKSWAPRETEYGSGAIWKYAQLVGPARYGALTNPGAKGEKEQYADI